MHLQEIIDQLKTDERNAAYTARGIGPIFQIHEEAKILIIGQAPGKKVEESGIPFHDKSGEKLMTWMGIDSQISIRRPSPSCPWISTIPAKPKRATNRRDGSSPRNTIVKFCSSCRT